MVPVSSIPKLVFYSKAENLRRMQDLKDDPAFLVQSLNCVEFIELETATNILTTIGMDNLIQ